MKFKREHDVNSRDKIQILHYIMITFRPSTSFVYGAERSYSVLRFLKTYSAKSPRSASTSVSYYFEYFGSVGSASAYQAVDNGFISRLRLTFLRRRKITRCLFQFFPNMDLTDYIQTVTLLFPIFIHEKVFIKTLAFIEFRLQNTKLFLGKNFPNRIRTKLHFCTNRFLIYI